MSHETHVDARVTPFIIKIAKADFRCHYELFILSYSRAVIRHPIREFDNNDAVQPVSLHSLLARPPDRTAACCPLTAPRDVHPPLVDTRAQPYRPGPSCQPHCLAERRVVPRNPP